MDATRRRFGSLAEWLLAAALFAGMLAAGALVVDAFRTVSAVMPVMASQPRPPEPPPSVPPRAVSVPLLPLEQGKQIRVGDTASRVRAVLGSTLPIGADAVERVGAGERITRFYERLGRRFVLVLESTDEPEPRVTAIYLQ